MSNRKRKVDESLLVKIRSLPCAACGRNGPSDPHHIITKARLGPDEEWNLIPLCSSLQGCHRLWHDKPLSEFLGLFPHLFEELSSRGFLWEPHFKKLIRPFI